MSLQPKTLLPISIYQKRFFTEWLLNPDNADYNEAVVFKIKGKFPSKTLKKSCELLIKNIDLTRAIYTEDGNECYVGDFRINDMFFEIDFDAKNSSLDNFLIDLMSKPFNLNAGPLLRFYLVSTDKNTKYFIACAHHVICDGVSSFKIISQIMKWYGLLLFFRWLPVKKDKVFINAIAEEQAVLKNKNYELTQKYWQTKLDSKPLVVNFRNMIHVKKETLNKIYFNLSGNEIKAFNELAAEYKSTFSLISTIYGIAIAKYTNQETITMSYPINMRSKKYPFSVGAFVNNIPLIVDLNSKTTFLELFESVANERIESKPHQWYTLSDIITDQRKVRQDDHNLRYFNAGIIDTNLNNFMIKLGVFKAKAMDLTPKKDGVYDISLSYDKHNAGTIKFKFEYKTNILDDDLANLFVRFIKNFIINCHKLKDQKLNEISFLDIETYNKIVYDWNMTNKSSLEGKLIHTLFEEQVLKTPNEVALVFEKSKITYQDLNSKANQLARHLVTCYQQATNTEFSVETFVSLYLDKSFEMIISILAVLKAGGCYVPIDPDYPQDRVEYIISDTNSLLILTQNKYIKQITGTSVEKVIIATDLSEKFYTLEESTNLFRNNIKPNNLAYIIYTSGTTGRPKGVMIEHKSAINLFNSMETIYNIKNHARVSLFTSYVFDVSVSEIFNSILYGLELHIIPNEIRRDANLVAKYLIDNKIEVSYLPPVLLGQISEHSFPNLINVIYAGEPCDKNIADIWSHKINLYNYYGPTEITIYCTGRKILKNEVEQIGKPIFNTKTYILDSNLKPVAIGMVGELYIGGAGVARGYLNKPELTQERFIENTFCTTADLENGYTKLYKTGDVVRYLSDGNIEYIGRNDDQVKIRGYRVELGGIEARISSIPGIKLSCVLARDKSLSNGTTIKYLVAYYVLEDGYEIKESDIIDTLSKFMAPYMIPSAFMQMDKFPLTINGKLDKKLLPEPVFVKKESYAAPSSDIEKLLCRIWGDVLGSDAVGINDDFFKIGGDSILGIQVINKMKQHGINYQVRDLFQYKTIKKLADGLNDLKNTVAPIINDLGILTGTFELLPIQKWFVNNVHNEVIKNFNHWNQCFFIKTPELDVVKLKRVLNELINYHDVLRIRFSKLEQVEVTQEYLAKVEDVELDVLNIKNFKSQELSAILTYWQSSFDLNEGELFKFGYLFGYADGSSRIYMACHHLIIDAVSWRIIANDIQALYNDEKLADKGSSYRQWVRAIANLPILHNVEYGYWKMIIDESKKFYNSHFLGAADTNTFELRTINLDFDLTSDLLYKSDKAYHTTTEELMLVALGYSLQKNNTEYDFSTISLEGHGREDILAGIDHSHTVGWFTTIYPVKIVIDNDIGSTIKHFKESFRAIPFKGVTFGAFAANENYDLSFDDLPEVCFNYLGTFDSNDQNWSLVYEDGGRCSAMENKSYYKIDINLAIIDGTLKGKITSSLEENLLSDFIENFKFNIHNILRHCSSQVEAGNEIYTPSDFPEFIPYNIVDNYENNFDLVFIFPPAVGGNEMYYKNLIPELKDKKIIVFNTFYTELVSRNIDLTSYRIEELAKYYMILMRKYQINNKTALLGWSFGGVLAFEIAKQLSSEGIQIKNLVLFDSYLNFKGAELSLPQHLELEFKQNINYLYQPENKLPQINVTLFKASKNSYDCGDLIGHNQFTKDLGCYLEQYYLSTEYNNLDQYADNINLIKVDCHHYEVLDYVDSNLIKQIIA